MRLKLSLIALFLTAAIVGIPYYLDSRIPRATAVIKVSPSSIPSFPHSFSRCLPNYFELIEEQETLQEVLQQLYGNSEEQVTFTNEELETLKA
jgi:hypothetical protein